MKKEGKEKTIIMKADRFHEKKTKVCGKNQFGHEGHNGA